MTNDNVLPSAKNSHDVVFLIGLMSIMLITVISFLIIQFLLVNNLDTPLNNNLLLSPNEASIVEEQV